MGLLDSVLGAVMGSGQSQTQNSGQAALINAVIQMIGNKQGGAGGLAGLVQAFTQSGMGNIANSWVGKGQNMPVSADQIHDALGGAGGGGLLAQLAQSAGMSQGDASSHLSQILPGLVDKLTPDGQIPHADSLESMLGAFSVGKN